MRASLALLALVPAAAAAGPCPTEGSQSVVIAGKLAQCDGDTHLCVVDDHGWKAVPAPPVPAWDVTPKEIVACTGADKKDCARVPATGFANDAQVATNDDRTLLAAWQHDKLEVYDVKSGKRLAAIKGWKNAMESNDYDAPTFAGSSLIVWQHASPVSSSARVFDLKTGKQRAVIAAGKEVDTTGPAIAVDAATWAIPTFNGKLFLVDGKTWKVKKTLALGADPGTPLLGKLADGRLVLQGTPPLLIDTATGKTEVYKAPACKK